MKLSPLTRLLMALAALITILGIARQMAVTSNPLTKTYQATCNPEKGCHIETDNGSIQVTFQPKHIVAMKPIHVQLTLNNIRAEKVSMSFAGRDMPMNMPVLNLSRLEKKQHNETYKGTGYITYCTTDPNMVWLLQLMIENQTQHTEVRFELEATP